MTVSRAYLHQMKAKQDKTKRRRAIEALGDPGLLRLHEIEERYADPEDPMALAIAQMQEIQRQNAIKLGVCADCLAKFPDPLGGLIALVPKVGQGDLHYSCGMGRVGRVRDPRQLEVRGDVAAWVV
jgi:hypothetical protein